MMLLFFLLWIILNGKISLELVIFGILISVTATYCVSRVTGYSPKNDLFILRNLPVFLFYILNLILEITQSAIHVMALIFEAEDPEPVIVEFHSGLRLPMQNVLLANSITLTPGTITVIQEDDHFVVHCLRKEFAEGLEESSFIKILRKLRQEEKT